MEACKFFLIPCVDVERETLVQSEIAILFSKLVTKF